MGPDDHQPRALRSARQQVEQRERRGVAPMEILEREDHDSIRGEPLQRLGDLAQHPLLSGALRGGVLSGASASSSSAGICASHDGA